MYGLLHSPEYRRQYHHNLSREIPRIPLVAEGERFMAFVRAGRELGDLHCGYERVDPWPLTLEWSPTARGLPEKSRFRCPRRMTWSGNMRNRDLTTLHYNRYLTIRDIPAEAWDYRVGRYPALKWIRNHQWQKTDPRTGLISDANEYSPDPRYILYSFARTVRVAMETLRIQAELPPLWS